MTFYRDKVAHGERSSKGANVLIRSVLFLGEDPIPNKKYENFRVHAVSTWLTSGSERESG